MKTCDWHTNFLSASMCESPDFSRSFFFFLPRASGEANKWKYDWKRHIEHQRDKEPKKSLNIDVWLKWPLDSFVITWQAHNISLHHWSKEDSVQGRFMWHDMYIMLPGKWTVLCTKWCFQLSEDRTKPPPARPLELQVIVHWSNFVQLLHINLFGHISMQCIFIGNMNFVSPHCRCTHTDSSVLSCAGEGQCPGQLGNFPIQTSTEPGN